MVLHGARPVLLGGQAPGLRDVVVHQHTVLVRGTVGIGRNGGYLVSISVLQPFHLKSNIPLQVFFGRCTLAFHQQIGKREVPLRLVLEEDFQITRHARRVHQVRERLVYHKHVVQQLRGIEVDIHTLTVQHEVDVFLRKLLVGGHQLVDIVLLYGFRRQCTVVDTQPVQVEVGIIATQHNLAVIAEVVVVLVGILPVLLAVDVDGHNVEPCIPVGIGHHDYCQADTHTVVYRYVLRRALLHGLGEEGYVLARHAQAYVVLRNGDDVLAGIRGILHLEVDFDGLAPAGGFRGEGAVVYHGPAAGEYLQCLHSVGVSRPSVVAPVQVAPLYRYGRLVHLVDDAPVIRLRVGTGPRIDIECGACRSRIAQRVVHRQDNGFRQGIRTVRHADCDAEVGIVIRLHLHRVGEGVPCVRHDGVILGTVHLHAASGDGEPCLGQCGRTVVDGVVEHRVVLPVGELFRHVVHAHKLHGFAGRTDAHDVDRYGFCLDGIVGVGKIETHVVYARRSRMLQQVDIRSIQIHGCAYRLVVALAVAVAGDGQVQRLVDVAVDYHRDVDVSGERRPPGEVRGADAQ